MGNVEFEENQTPQESILYGRFVPTNEPPKLVKLLLKTGVVKTYTQANIVLLTAIGIFTAAAVFIFLFIRGPAINPDAPRPNLGPAKKTMSR